MSTTDQSMTAMPAFREWLTTTEIHELRLPGIPASKRAAYILTTNLHLTGNPRLVRKRVPVKTGKRGPPLGGGLEFHYTSLPPEAAVAYEARFGRPVKAAGSPQGLAKLGKSVIAQAEGGRLRAFLQRHVIADPDASAAWLRDQCVAEFGAKVTVLPNGRPIQVPMPPLRTFQYHIQAMRRELADHADQ